MSDATTLATIKTQILARLQEITATPKPSYSIDGQSISWNEYFVNLTDALEKINKQLANAEGPFEGVTTYV